MRNPAVPAGLPLCATAVSAVLFGLATPALAQDARPDGAQSAQNNALADEITPELDDAVKRGLAYLAGAQNEDGSFGGGRYAKNVAITALAGIAFMADGNVPGRGEYAPNVERALEYILNNAAENGLIASDAANGPMYGHGFATLFLGEVYGMTPGGGDTEQADRVYEALSRACRLIERTQNDQGGWRYNPVPYDADVSVTICQIMGLRAARNAGLEIDKTVIDRAVTYVRQCQNPDGGFKYQLESGASAWPRSAAGVASLYYAGIYEDDAIDDGLGYLLAAAKPGEEANGAHYYYGHYYAVQTMYLAGGDYWAQWWPAIRAELLKSQAADGSWSDPSVGDAYGTAMSLIILQMPKRYLPIFQK
ncbi:MAG: terpene cyclase/mutase family protein [Phycisphaerales bacterium]|nr:terpene cyclase/mutase family protein [Phycisphaerales bacterium]